MRVKIPLHSGIAEQLHALSQERIQAVLSLIHIFSGKIVKNSDDQKTAKGYFLAGNGLGGFFIAGSMLLTNLSSENLVGLSGPVSYTHLCNPPHCIIKV